VYDGLYDAVAVIVYEAEWSTLVGDGQSELIVIHQTHLQRDNTTTRDIVFK